MTNRRLMRINRPDAYGISLDEFDFLCLQFFLSFLNGFFDILHQVCVVQPLCLACR